LVVAVVLLGGCYEDPDVTVHEAHVYKGKADVHAEDAAARAETLRQRFSQVQTDR
jgi:hypothetical protein